MTTPNSDDLFRLGVQSAKNGQRDGARMMFQQVLQQNERDVRAMLWMAKVANDLEERETWLRRVLKVDPKNETALKALGTIENKEEAQRNMLYLRIGVVGYVVGLMVLSLIFIAIFGS